MNQPQKKTLISIAARLYLSIAFIKECNYKCGYCHPFGESKITHGQNLTQTELEEIIDAAVDSGFRVFRFTGGECTILPWFGDILEYTLLRQPSAHVNICTNGSTLDKHMALFDRHKDRISLRVSLDSTNSAHVALGFDKILNDSLKASLLELSRRHISTRFNVVVMQPNKSEIAKIIEYAALLGFDVKLIDLYTQDQYIATNGVAGNKRDLLQIKPLDYWRQNYVALNKFIADYQPIASDIIHSYNKDGGFGIPM